MVAITKEQTDATGVTKFSVQAAVHGHEDVELYDVKPHIEVSITGNIPPDKYQALRELILDDKKPRFESIGYKIEKSPLSKGLPAHTIRVDFDSTDAVTNFVVKAGAILGVASLALSEERAAACSTFLEAKGPKK